MPHLEHMALAFSEGQAALATQAVAAEQHHQLQPQRLPAHRADLRFHTCSQNCHFLTSLTWHFLGVDNSSSLIFSVRDIRLFSLSTFPL